MNGFFSNQVLQIISIKYVFKSDRNYVLNSSIYGEKKICNKFFCDKNRGCDPYFETKWPIL